MTNTNTNQTKEIKIQTRLFGTAAKEAVLVFNEPNKGWNYVVIKSILKKDNSGIERIEWVNVSHDNIAITMFPIVEALYKNKVSKPVSKPNVRPSANRPVLIKDYSELLLNIPNCKVAKLGDTDVNGTTLEVYLKGTFGNATPDSLERVLFFPLVDFNTDVADASDIVTDNLQEVIYEPEIWNNLTPDEAAGCTVHMDDALYDSIISTPSFEKIAKYVSFKDPATGNNNFALCSDPGVGKTTTIEALAKYLNVPYAKVACSNTMSLEDIFISISPDLDATSNKQWTINKGLALKVCTIKGIINFDEVNNLVHSTQEALHNVISASERSVILQNTLYKIHPDTIFAATMNYREQGNKALNGAFKDRFKFFKVVPAPTEVLAKYYTRVYPHLNPEGLFKYVEFMKDIAIPNSQDVFENQDQYSPDTPAYTFRDIPRILKETILFKNFKEVLTDDLVAKTIGVADNEKAVKDFLVPYESLIEDIQRALFTPVASVQANNELLEGFYADASVAYEPVPADPDSYDSRVNSSSVDWSEVNGVVNN
jgi:DNA polymerase III delta prime subunit